MGDGTSLVASFQIYPIPSKVACAQRIADWTGVLVSDGSLVSQHLQGVRQRYVVHLIRTAKGLTKSMEAGIARCGARAHPELQRLCHMDTERTMVRQWPAWYARFSQLLNQHATREDKAGMVARRLE